MYDRTLLARMKVRLDNLLNGTEINKKIISETETAYINPAKKTVYCYLDGKIVADYESISKCAIALGMSRAMVKKSIDNAIVLENGFKLSLTN